MTNKAKIDQITEKIHQLLDDSAVESYYCLVANRFGGVNEISSPMAGEVKGKSHIIQAIGRLIMTNSDEVLNIFHLTLEYLYDNHPEVFSNAGLQVKQDDSEKEGVFNVN